MIPALALLAALGVAVPHCVRLDHVRPTTAALLWMTALTLRAAVVVSLVAYIALLAPDTEAFGALTHWCQHTMLPVVGLHVDLQGHVVGRIATVAPVMLAALCMLAGALGAARAAGAVRRALANESLGAGPQNSVIVGGPEVIMAAAGLVHPRILVSAGALAVLDDEELGAALAHEQGHIAHRHHLLLAYGESCRALARVLPGTRRAVSEMRFHLERDADEWAVRGHHDPVALASAICKAARGGPENVPVVITLGGGGIERRLDELLDARPCCSGTRRRRVVDYGAAMMVCVALACMVALPATTFAGARGPAVEHPAHQCRP